MRGGFTVQYLSVQHGRQPPIQLLLSAADNAVTKVMTVLGAARKQKKKTQGSNLGSQQRVTCFFPLPKNVIVSCF